MPCYHPLTAWRAIGGINKDTGKWKITFDPTKGHPSTEMKIPCGQCIGCRLERSRQWAVRCVHEAKFHAHNSFITLTYNDAHLPSDGSLQPRHFQLFLKRLRKRLDYESDIKIRFFHCGEYGSEFARPHYHAIIFGYDFPDKVLWSVRSGVKLYRSLMLEELWTYGFSTVGAVTFESAAYVARYVLKKVTGDAADAHYHGRKPEYVTMSRKPGIAHDWIVNNYRDVYPRDSVLVRPDIHCKPPRYYDSIYDLISPEKSAKIRLERRLTGKSKANDPNNTYERLATREEYKTLQCSKLVRGYEKE